MQAIETKLDWYKFYPKDYETNAKILGMDLEEQGLYLRCINHCWINDYLPDDLKLLARLVRVSIRKFKRLWEGIKDCFERIDGRLRHRNLYDQKLRANLISSTKKAASLARWNAEVEQNQQNVDAYAFHPETDIEDRTESAIADSSGVRRAMYKTEDSSPLPPFSRKTARQKPGEARVENTSLNGNLPHNSVAPGITDESQGPREQDNPETSCPAAPAFGQSPPGSGFLDGVQEGGLLNRSANPTVGGSAVNRAPTTENIALETVQVNKNTNSQECNTALTPVVVDTYDAQPVGLLDWFQSIWPGEWTVQTESAMRLAFTDPEKDAATFRVNVALWMRTPKYREGRYAGKSHWFVKDGIWRHPPPRGMMQDKGNWMEQGFALFSSMQAAGKSFTLGTNFKPVGGRR